MPDRRDILQLGAAAALTAVLPRAARAAVDTTLLVTHPAFHRHATGPLHPERPARMTAIDTALANPAFAGLTRELAPLRDDVEAAILRVHSANHLARVKAVATDKTRLPHAFDPDTVISEGSSGRRCSARYSDFGRFRDSFPAIFVTHHPIQLVLGHPGQAKGPTEGGSTLHRFHADQYRIHWGSDTQRAVLAQRASGIKTVSRPFPRISRRFDRSAFRVVVRRRPSRPATSSGDEQSGLRRRAATRDRPAVAERRHGFPWSPYGDF